ncbi:hypothetical protein ACH4GK_37685 [Streptomyces rimosus]|uniref:hypothetical protein n=1 Tax=Streptomyces rimosus TaxID=1927 RepID=UPI0004CC2B1B|nr:hypothetical protein [Streptomyces rimosus]
MTLQPDDETRGWGEPLTCLPSPWPELDEYLHLRPGHLVGIGAASDSRERDAGYQLALHTAAHGHPTLLCAPDLTPRNPVPNLTVQRLPELDPDRIERALAACAHTDRPIGLVVIDPFHRMHADRDSGPLAYPEQAGEVGRRLKILASTPAYHRPVIIVMARLSPPPAGESPALRHLGLAAELEYDTDTLLLLNRTSPRNVEALIVKDRHGPAPTKATISW